MIWLAPLFVAILCGGLGLLLAGTIALSCVTWYRIPSREGESGYFIVFVAVIGGLVSAVVGLISAMLIAWIVQPSLLYETMGANAIVLLISGAVALGCRSFADIAPKLDGLELNLEVEFRFPVSQGDQAPRLREENWEFAFSSLGRKSIRKQVRGEIQFQSIRFESGRWIVPTKTLLFTQRGRRLVTLAPQQATEVMSFLLPLPASPNRRCEAWSEWLPRQAANGEAWPDDRMSCRFRICKNSQS